MLTHDCVHILGTVALVVVGILAIPDLNVQEVGVAMDWLFLLFLPNYCFAVALGDLYVNYETVRSCNLITPGDLNLDETCDLLWNSANVTTICCKG